MIYILHVTCSHFNSTMITIWHVSRYLNNNKRLYWILCILFSPTLYIIGIRYSCKIGCELVQALLRGGLCHAKCCASSWCLFITVQRACLTLSPRPNTHIAHVGVLWFVILDLTSRSNTYCSWVRMCVWCVDGAWQVLRAEEPVYYLKQAVVVVVVILRDDDQQTRDCKESGDDECK